MIILKSQLICLYYILTPPHFIVFEVTSNRTHKNIIHFHLIIINKHYLMYSRNLKTNAFNSSRSLKARKYKAKIAGSKLKSII